MGPPFKLGEEIDQRKKMIYVVTFGRNKSSPLEYHSGEKGTQHEIHRWILANARRHDASLRYTSS